MKKPIQIHPQIQGGSSFDPETLSEVMSFMETMEGKSQEPEAEPAGPSPEEQAIENERRITIMQHFVSESEAWPLIKESLDKIVEKYHKEFEESGDHDVQEKRRVWHTARAIVKEICGNIVSAAGKE